MHPPGLGGHSPRFGGGAILLLAALTISVCAAAAPSAPPTVLAPCFAEHALQRRAALVLRIRGGLGAFDGLTEDEEEEAKATAAETPTAKESGDTAVAPAPEIRSVLRSVFRRFRRH
jgi:hypothetical protein